MNKNPENRVWKGKSYKKGGITGRDIKRHGTTIRKERELDLERAERNLEVARGD